eukprot:4655420-Pyramimonas_sp.AAC.1
MVQRVRLAWFLDVMVLAQEVTRDGVQELRRLQSALDGGELVPEPGHAAPPGAQPGAAAAAAVPSDGLG